jgi:hypothetical protein
MDFLPSYEFRKCVERYDGHYKVQTFSCWEQFLAMAFAQLTYRESLRDIQACLLATRPKLYHMGLRSPVFRNTLANANRVRDWRIYADFAQVHDVNILDILPVEPGALYVMNRGYVDFARLFALHQARGFFVTRAKSNFRFRRLYSHPVGADSGIQCDQTIVLSGFRSRQGYPEKLRRIRFYDAEKDKRFVFLTDHFDFPAEAITQLYRCRWQVELFFKWIKQHLRIKVFFGTSESAVKSQVWIAISIHVLVAIMKKRLHLDASLYTILQVLSVSLFEKMPISQAFAPSDHKNPEAPS